jgi:hypothetical protein
MSAKKITKAEQKKIDEQEKLNEIKNSISKNQNNVSEIEEEVVILNIAPTRKKKVTIETKSDVGTIQILKPEVVENIPVPVKVVDIPVPIDVKPMIPCSNIKIKADVYDFW